jgi:nucleoside-diphosphate-sugar epimerase
MPVRSCLIAGCGDVGTRLGLELAAAGVAVTGLRRSGVLPEPLQTLRADLTQPASLAPLTAADALVYLPTPSQRSETGYRAIFIAGLANLLDALPQPPARLVFVSSTAVYGEADAGWVDEHTIPAPHEFNGRVLLEAETLARGRVAATSIVRLAGIYGPGREALIRRVREGGCCRAEPPLYTNRIHAADAARLLAHVLALAAPAPLYLGVDDEPAPQCAVMDFIARRLGLPAPPRAANDPTPSRRISNAALRRSGFGFRYPTFREGYGELLAGAVQEP